MSGRWLVSPAFDLGLISGPALLAAAVALALPAGLDLPGWGYLVFVLVFDVAHVYASLWRTYFDPEERERRPALLTMAPAAALVGCVVVHAVSPAWFWTAMAYLAVYHFARQAMGFAMLYRLKAGRPMGDLSARVERWLVYGLTLAPVAWWHASLPRPYDWFMPGDFLPGLPMPVALAASAVTAALALAHLAFRLREGVLTPGRDLWLLATAAVWVGGIVFARGDFAFTLPNVVAHGLPYFALVGLTVRRKWLHTGEGPGRWIRGPGWLGFLLPLVALAWAEEALWDIFAWGDHPWLFGHWDFEALATHPIVPLLAVPQVTHYLLDAWIWKLGEQNPGLRRWVMEAA